MTKSAKNLLEPVIENVIILGYLLTTNLWKQWKSYKFEEISHIFYLTFIVNEVY